MFDLIISVDHFKMYKVADFFCGAGGFSEGFRQAGFKIEFALDRWDVAINTHKLNHPDTNHKIIDILSLPAEKINLMIPDTEIIIGSPPCVSFSTSNRAGKANKSLGIKLIEKYLQIVAIKKHKKGSILKYWIMENVPNSKDHVEPEYTFKMLGLNKQTLTDLDIHKDEEDIALVVPLSKKYLFNSANYGVPQKRIRFITGDFPYPEQEHDETSFVSLGHVLNSLRKKGEQIKDPIYDFKINRDELTDHYYDTTIPKADWYDAKIKKTQARYYGKMSFPEDESKPSRTVMATRSIRSRESMIISNGKPNTYRAPTIREIACLMSYPITYQFQAKDESSKYRLVGNSVPPKLAQSIAVSILKTESLRYKLKPNPKTNPDLLIVNLNDNPPPIKNIKKRHPKANFAEIIPNFKFRNFRVELDNGFPKLGKGEIIWSSSIHHATGKESMKKAMPSSKETAILLSKIKKEKEFELFIHEMNKLIKNIPDKHRLQELYTNHKYDDGQYSPRVILSTISNMVKKHFPQEKYEDMYLSNYKVSKSQEQILRFDKGGLNDTQIPLVVAVGLHALCLVTEHLEKKN